MPHRVPAVIFAVGNPREPRHCSLRHNLSNEDDSAAVAIVRAPPDVEPQVDLVKIRVEGKREISKKLRAQKPKSHQTYVRLAAKRIEVRPARDVILQQPRIHLVIQHYQVAPLRREKNTSALVAFGHYPRYSPKFPLRATFS